jgi:agenet domain-containing protein
MTKSTTVASQPTVILFSQTSIGKPKAGVFKGTEIEAARKAATKLGLKIFEVSDQRSQSIAAKIPPGRLQAHGEAIVPFVAKQLYAAIEALATPSQNALQPQKQTPRLPTDWDNIKVGDRVLAQDADPKDGWWQVTVVEKAGDLFKLRWPGRSNSRAFQRHRATLGLICPGGFQPTPEPRKRSGQLSARFPQDWADIDVDHVVLAKEDGPCEQWWEAKVVKADQDAFTLQWRDFPDLSTIERVRASLGLLHPSPKSRPA